MLSSTVYPRSFVAELAACLTRSGGIRPVRTLQKSIALSLTGVGLLAGMALATPVSADGPRVTLSTTKGDIVLELDDQRAPLTVQNFLGYVDAGFYDDTVFHRVIEGFMIQGGGFNTRYQRKSTRAPVSNEAYNGLRNLRYTIAMARTTQPHSATSQFFINSEDNANLDHTSNSTRGWGYAVFGRVVEGQDVVDAVSSVRTGPGGSFSRDVPVEPVIILSASRVQEQQENAVSTADGSVMPKPSAVRASCSPVLSLEASDPAVTESVKTVGQN